VILSWVALQPSRQERRWRLTGAAVAAAAAIALVAAALRSGFNAALLLLAIGAAIAAWRLSRLRAVGPAEIGVDDEGTVVLRGPQSKAIDPVPLHCRFAAPWLITLRHGSTLISIWPDSLPEAAYRRLWVHLRWMGAAAREERRAEAKHVE
jgi:hypothetical protein